MPPGPTQRPQDGGYLAFKKGCFKGTGEPFVNVYFTHVQESVRAPGYAKARIAQVTGKRLRVHPLTTIQVHPNYLQPRYSTLRTIELVASSRFPFSLPTTTNAFNSLWESARPEGMGAFFEFGLTFLIEYATFPLVLGKLGVHTLRFDGEWSSEEVSITNGVLTLERIRYSSMLKKIRSIATQHRKNAKEEKVQFLEDVLIRNAPPLEYIAPTPKLRRGQLAHLTARGAVTAENLTKQDQQALVSTVQNNVETIVKNAPASAMRLRSDIELVTLKELIAKFEKHLDENHNEPFWQKFFTENPFILSLAFATPVLQVHDNAYVGGRSFTGDGGKFADYLYKTGSTGNLCIVEIKKPSTDLLKATPYRERLYQASSELVGAVTQVMDQRMHLNHDIHQLVRSSRQYDLQAHSVQCVVVAGKDLTDEDKQKSFELFRTSLNSVSVLTFDELLARLREIDRVLTEEKKSQTEPTLSTTPDDSTEEET